MDTEDPGQIREPLVDGVFYESDPEALRTRLRSLISSSGDGSAGRPPTEARGILAPSASYDYVGRTMATAYRRLRPADNPIVVLLAAGQHVEPGYASLPESPWFRTPLGFVPVDQSICAELREASESIIADDFVHLEEHAIETQLPFLQYMLDDFSIVPILVGSATEASINGMAAAISSALADAERDHLVVLGMNLTSYQSRDEARREGTRFLDHMSAGRWRSLLDPQTAFTVGSAGRSAAALFLATIPPQSGCTVVSRENSSFSSDDPSTTVEYAACTYHWFDDDT